MVSGMRIVPTESNEVVSRFAARKSTRPCGLKSRIAGRFARFNDDEDGGMIILGLFIFILMLFIGGMGVDLMRFEARRAMMQATTDAAVLAAANLDQQVDSEALVRSYFERAGIDPDTVTVAVETETEGDDIMARTVNASAGLDLNTFFMHMLGINNLQTTVGSAANESYTNVEISLVVDISGSMSGNKLADLKVAAKQFVNEVVDETRTVGVTSVSIIPYNHTVVVGDLLDRLNADGTVVQIAEPRPYNGALEQYNTEHDRSTCIRFYDEHFFPAADMATDYRTLRAISPDQELERLSNFARRNRGFVRPSDWMRQCNETRTPILVHSTSISQLESHINRLQAGGNTAIDVGVKWGVALLDPAMRPVIDDMINDNELPTTLRNRPGNYGTDSTMKILVVMTDGKNTTQYDIDRALKSGATRVWYSDRAGSTLPADVDYFPVDGREKQYNDGYFVEFPQLPAHRRFFRPEDLSIRNDGTYYAAGAVPDDLRQLDRHELYDRLSNEDIADAFFLGIDTAAERRESRADVAFAGNTTADARLSSICEAARVDNDMLVYTIAFQAPQEGQDAMRDCATADGYYYDVSTTNISDAFSSIAGSISQLRLTQ